VALTRAQYGLKVIAATPPQKISYKNFSHFLYEYVGSIEYSTGEHYDFRKLKREESQVKEMELDYVSYPADSGRRLRFSPEAADYFGEDGLVGAAASTRIRGNVLHGILSAVTLEEDLPGAVEAAIQSGDLPLSMKEETLKLLESRLAYVGERGWFSKEVRVRSEAAILSADGLEFRPDRVVLFPDGSVQVIDYKFGQREEKYRNQVLRYVNLYKKMGYEKVEGYIWYLEDNLIIFVN
jgi:ATP-dependent exoDNAse (exonuclease V) beta subunit